AKAGTAVTKGSDAIYSAADVEALMMQHGMVREETWMLLPSMFICLQQDLFAAVSHAPKIEDWHASAAAGWMPTRPSDNATITSARIG
ncbi:MAG TPA: hypothetical protein VGS27_14045, partial [Candidatus Sulfotelmatobacter sp.]|nr:hypothetical protein [Candidatus Sulfotelmatobacter sp.]